MPETPRGASGPMRIVVRKDGPFQTSGHIPLSVGIIGIDSEGFSYEWREGKAYPSQERYSLCRCGQSKQKPFCDGTHSKIGFDGTETATRKQYLDQAERIEGPSLTLTDAPILCAAARFCDRAGGIWDLVQQSDNPEARAIAIDEAANCPSGRLVLVEDPQEDMNGPIWVRGRIPVESADGSVYELRNSVALCRCGQSSNKPFCDGSHCE
jgi:CDGSH-type Zn-finger protein